MLQPFPVVTVQGFTKSKPQQSDGKTKRSQGVAEAMSLILIYKVPQKTKRLEYPSVLAQTRTDFCCCDTVMIRARLMGDIRQTFQLMFFFLKSISALVYLSLFLLFFPPESLNKNAIPDEGWWNKYLIQLKCQIFNNSNSLTVSFVWHDMTTWYIQ